MLLIALLRSQVSVRVCVRMTHPKSENADLCLSQKPREWISKRASGASLAPWFNVSPVTSWRTRSTSTSLQTILSISAFRSRSSLWRWIMTRRADTPLRDPRQIDHHMRRSWKKNLGTASHTLITGVRLRLGSRLLVPRQGSFGATLTFESVF